MSIASDSNPLFSEPHPQWLLIKGASWGIEAGSVVRILWKRFARKAKPGERKICLVRSVSRYDDGTVAIFPIYLSDDQVYTLYSNKTL